MSGDTEALLGTRKETAQCSLADAHLAAAHVQAKAIHGFTFVLALGGLVMLLAILYESYAWRQTVWHVVNDAGVSESKAWRELMKDFIQRFPHWFGR